MKNRDKIIKFFKELPEGTIVSANEIYGREFAKMSEQAFFKALERLVKEEILARPAKGMYCLDESRNEDDILNHFFGENNDNGMYIGQKLYKKYAISNVQTDEIELYSNIINKSVCNIGNIHVKRIDVELTYENARVIEALEIMQNYDNIEELNKYKFARFAKQFAKGYDDVAAVYVISRVRYKKSTIAFMKKVLDMYKVPNTLGQFLSVTSKYKIPPVQRIA
ncbi:MAG: hypothetical protein IJB96_05400, partial [Lachnospira sp.]|nr:hypothetical protein [Lachnospira sp.]